MKKTLYLLIILVQLVLLSSCKNNKFPKDVEKALSFAGDNKKELLKVINIYNKNVADSLKLRAVYYLISNMIYHKYDDRTDTYKNAFDQAKEARGNFKLKYANYEVNKLAKYTNDIFSKAIDSIQMLPSFDNSFNLKYDIQSINSKFLIENIEMSFEAYEKNPLKLAKNFDDFLKYILPYRAENEPIEHGKRKELFEKNKWVFDSLKTIPLQQVVNKLFRDAELSDVIWGKKYKYPVTPSLSQMEDTRFGNCNNLVSYMVNVFRSVGIPAGVDYVPRWGASSKSNGHSWLFYHTKDSFEARDAVSDDNQKLRNRYRISDIPKVFRSSFENPMNNEDVTSLYRKSYDIVVDILWGKNNISDDNVFLCVFDRTKGWDNIQKSFEISNEKVHFKSIGNNLIYIAIAKYNGKLIPLNYPFELQKDGTLRFFKTDHQKIKEVTLLRKYPPFFIRHQKSKTKRIKSINGAILQGANINSTEKFKDLYKIEKFNTTHIVNFKIDKEVCYKYYRLKGLKNQSTYLASFKLIDSKMEVIKNFDTVKIFEGNSSMVQDILDDDPLTNMSKRDLRLTYSFKKPQCIEGFQIQARNDDNHIKIGDSYELLYWDKEWTSLGSKIAQDTLLMYQNVPKNTLYWLRNHTRGKEELVFSFDDKGKQFWTGTTEYETLDRTMIK